MTSFVMPYTSDEQTLTIYKSATQLYSRNKWRLNDDNQTTSDSDLEVSDASTKDEPISINILIRKIKLYTECLVELGSSLCCVAPDDLQAGVAASLGIQQRSAHDYHTALILEKHPQTDPDLAKVLGQLSWDRYERLQLNRTGQTKTSTNSDGKSRIVGTEFQDSGVGTSLSGTLPSYAKSTVSFMTSLTTGGDRVQIPPLPAAAKNGGSFECLACCQKVQVIGNRAWR